MTDYNAASGQEAPESSERWLGPDSALAQFVLRESGTRLEGYRLNRGDIEEHAAIEQSVIDGGYRHRQLFELIQNAADARRYRRGCPRLTPVNNLTKPEYTDRSLRGRDAGLAESSAGVPAFAPGVAAFAGRCRSEQARLGGAEGAGAGEREACAGMLARASDPGRHL